MAAGELRQPPAAGGRERGRLHPRRGRPDRGRPDVRPAQGPGPRRRPRTPEPSPMTFPFVLSAVDGRARTGTLATPRGEIRTPAFMPVGTAGTVKALTDEPVRQTGVDILLGNT